MKQLTQNLRTGNLSVDEVPHPIVQPGKVLLQTAYSLISAGTERTKIETGRKSLLGKARTRPDQVQQVLQSLKTTGLRSTYHKVKTRLDARSPLGYSASGVVLEVGSGVDEFRPDDWVACGGGDAGHAEVICVPRNLCLKVPTGVGLDEATFTTLGAIALQGIRQSKLKLGEVGVVIGLGLLGQLTAQMLKAAGCLVLGLDPNMARCESALKSGADGAVSKESALRAQLQTITEAKGCDAVLITAGTASNRPIELAGEVSRDKGRVVVVGAVGLHVPRAPYFEKELEMRLSRSYGPGRYDASYEEKGIDYPYGYVRWTERRNMAAFLRLVADNKVNVKLLITHRFKLTQAEEAYELISGKAQEPYLGVLFEYNERLQDWQHTQVKIRPAEPIPDGNLGIGFIGAGNFAQSVLLPHLRRNPDVSLISVATIDPLQSRDVAERFGFACATSNPAEILDDETVGAVVIATRHDSHAALVLAALNAGKAIHVEKPLAMNPDELGEIRDVYSSKQGRRPFVMVGFNRRFAQMVQNAKKFLQGSPEPLAITYRINAGYIPLDHWTQDSETGGGRVIGEVCHFLDLLQYFAGARIIRVFAQALPNIGKYRDDNVAITVVMADGSIGTILYTANGDKAYPKEHLEVYRGGRLAVIDDFRTLKLVADNRIKTIRQGAQDKGHKGEVAAWVKAIRHGKPEPVPFEQASTATLASFAVMQSISKGQVVEI